MTVTAVLATAAGSVFAASGNVVILRGPAKSYKEATAAMIESLQEKAHAHVVIELATKRDADANSRITQQIAEAEPAVIAAAGAKATAFALEATSETPVVFFVVPNALDLPFLAPGSRHRHRLAGVATDIPPDVQLDWITRLHGRGKNLGILFSRRTQNTLGALRTVAQARHIEISPIQADRSAFPKAIDALNAARCDSVLMLPDLQIYNRATIQRLLLWGLRRKKPVWAFSVPIVKAGALAGQHADNQAIGRQAAAVVHEILNGKSPDQIGLQYPAIVQRAVNKRTAEMIGVTLDPTIVEKETQRFGDRQ